MSAERSRALIATGSILNTALEKVSARIAVSEYARATLVAHLGGDAVLIPNGVDVRSFSQAKPLEELPGVGGARLGFLGRIDEPRKGLDVLLAALPAIVPERPDVQLLVAGPGDVDDLRDDLPPELVPHVTFLGLVSDDDKARLLATVDLYVAPNTGGESLASSCSKPWPPVRRCSPATSKPSPRSSTAAGAAPCSRTATSTTSLTGWSSSSVTPTSWPPCGWLLTTRSVATTGRAWPQDVLAVYETVIPGQGRVREDTRLQVLGRFTRLRDES